MNISSVKKRKGHEPLCKTKEEEEEVNAQVKQVKRHFSKETS